MPAQRVSHPWLYVAGQGQRCLTTRFVIIAGCLCVLNKSALLKRAADELQ